MTPRAVLIGLPGAGKTTTGRRLAKILYVPFADSDDIVEHAHQLSVREFFAIHGEIAFRAAEAAAIVHALNDFDGVLAIGGGALTTEATRTAILASAVPVVLLQARLETLGARVGDAASRPLLAGDPEARLAQLDRERAESYRESATFTVETDQRTPGQVAAAIAARLHENSARA